MHDIAFLAMDLERLVHPELGKQFLDTYPEFSARPCTALLAHHYIAYRALVRVKVACLRSEQESADGPEQAREEAGRYASLAQLSRGESVVLDASWTREFDRRRAHDLAAATASDLVALELHRSGRSDR